MFTFIKNKNYQKILDFTKHILHGGIFSKNAKQDINALKQ